jgi:hypothetical protein
MRKSTTRREAMTLGLGAVVLGARGAAAAEDPDRGATKIGHHFQNEKEATIHIVGSFNPAAKDTAVKLEGEFSSGGMQVVVKWNPNPVPVPVGTFTAHRIKVKSTPSWPRKKDDGRGIGTLTVTVTNDGPTPSYTEPAVSYE